MFNGPVVYCRAVLETSAEMREFLADMAEFLDSFSDENHRVNFLFFCFEIILSIDSSS